MKYTDSEYHIYKSPEGPIFLEFPFKICKSFLSYSNRHPITVPAVFKDVLLDKQVAQGEKTLLVVDSSLEYAASIRYGENNTTDYFQITSSIDQDIVDCFLLHTVILVTIKIDVSEIVIFINRQDVGMIAKFS